MDGKHRCTGLSTGPITGDGTNCIVLFPYYANYGDSLKIAADTAVFVYDTLGRMKEANNRYARVRRTFFRAGALKTDTTAIGFYDSPWIDHYTRGQS